MWVRDAPVIANSIVQRSRLASFGAVLLVVAALIGVVCTFSAHAPRRALLAQVHQHVSLPHTSTDTHTHKCVHSTQQGAVLM